MYKLLKNPTLVQHQTLKPAARFSWKMRSLTHTHTKNLSQKLAKELIFSINSEVEFRLL